MRPHLSGFADGTCDFVVPTLITTSYQARVELRHLRYFVAVAEALSYRSAAESLRVAQPALSKQIKDLEADVGVRLLDRDTGGVTLTDAGVVFLEEAKDILERAEMAAHAAREAAAGKSGRLTIGSLGPISASLLPPALAVFRQKFPRVEINLHDFAIPHQLEALRRGEIQLSFAVDQHGEAPEDLHSAEVFVGELAIVLSREHRLAQRAVVSLADVSDEMFLSVSSAGNHEYHRKLIDRIFAARGIQHRRLKPVNGLESLVALIAGGHGVSLLLPSARSAGSDGIVFRRIKEHGDDLKLRLLAIWRKRGSSQFAQNFVQVLRSQRRTGSG